MKVLLLNLKQIFVILCVMPTTSFFSSVTRRPQGNTQNNLLQYERKPTDSEREAIIQLEKERRDAYLMKKVRPWEGNYDILIRRKQVPSIEYTKAADVVHIIMSAFGEMDCPQLDHGAAVALSFASPGGTLANSGLDPAAYGRFLRASHASLIDWRNWRVVKSEECSTDDVHVKREIIEVQVRGWGSVIGGDDGNDDEGAYYFHLNKNSLEGIWLLDVILKKNNVQL